MIYVKAFKIIYGIMKAVLLFYKKIVGDLTTIEFRIKPIDPCVTKKLVNGKNLAVVWHVEYIKIIRERNNIVTRMANWIKKTNERFFEY